MFVPPLPERPLAQVVRRLAKQYARDEAPVRIDVERVQVRVLGQGHVRMIEKGGVINQRLDAALEDQVAGRKGMVGLAVPVILAEIGWTTMGLVDTLMVGPLGPAAIGAVGLGSIVFLAIGIFGLVRRRTLIGMLISGELIFSAASLNVLPGRSSTKLFVRASPARWD